MPTPSLAWRPYESSLVVLRVGDPSGLNVLNTPPGTALSVHFDYLDASGAVWLTRALPTNTSDPSSVPCTLSHAQGELGASSTLYWLETEGLPSLPLSQDRVMVPCHASPAGARIGALLADEKAIGILSRNGFAASTVRFAGYTGMRGTSSGLRQVASPDAQEFWVGGIANSVYGLRYLSSQTDSSAQRVHGSVFYPESPLRYQAGSLDLRGVGMYGSQVFMTSSYAAEPNRNMDRAPYTPWGGVIRVGDYNLLARNSTSVASLLRGFDGRRSFWTFIFEASRSMWLIEDVGAYTRAAAAAAEASDARMHALAPGSVDLAGPASTRPTLYRSRVGSAIVNWGWSHAAVAWAEVPATKTYLPEGEAAYSLAGRLEASGGGPTWTVYTTTRARLYRVRPASRSYEVLAAAPAGTIYRGVTLPPYPPMRGTPTPSTPSHTSTSTPMPTRSRTHKGKPRGG